MKAASLHFAARGWILAAALIVLLAARTMTDAPLRPAWLLLVLAGILLRAWAGAHLGPHGNAARAQAPALAMGGPYRFSRNPLYLSNILAASGLLLYAHAFPATASIAFLAVVVLHHALLVRHEENVLTATHGEAYAAYRRATPRWIGLPRGAETQREQGGGASLRTTGVRQGRNAGYALACVFLVWIAAIWF